MKDSSFRHGLSTRSGHVKVNLEVMTNTVTMLKENPSLPAKQLWPLLQSALPTAAALDSKYLNNFRIRVADVHAKHSNSNLVKMEDSLNLASKKKYQLKKMYLFMIQCYVLILMRCLVKL